MAIKTSTAGDITELSALRTMASYVGIPKLIALADIPNDPDFALLQNILDSVIITVLAQGLPVNTDFNFKLTDVDGGTGDTLIPPGALTVDFNDPRFVERDGFVYDTVLQSTVQTINMEAKVVWNMDFAPLPEIIKRYMVVLASRDAVARIKGDVALSQLTIPDEAKTKIEFQRYVFNTGNETMLNGADTLPIHFRRNNTRRFI